MTLQLTRKLFTVAEYHKLAEVGILTEADRVELINGEIIAMTPIKSKHAGTVNALLELLFPLLNGKATIICQNPINLSEHSEPEPDITIAKYSTDSYRHAHPASADIHLVIEVSDTTLEKDRELKTPLYAAANIPEYWIINLPDKQVEIHRNPKNGIYHFKQIISTDEPVICEAIKFSIPYSTIF